MIKTSPADIARAASRSGPSGEYVARSERCARQRANFTSATVHFKVVFYAISSNGS
jgi:hypothetical protein